MAKGKKLKKISTSLGEKHHRVKGGHKNHKMAVKAHKGGRKSSKKAIC